MVSVSFLAFSVRMRLKKYIARLLENSQKGSPKVVQDELFLAFSEKVAEDRKPRRELTLAEHDKIEHPDGFNPKTDTCKFREKLKEKDSVDLIYATSDIHHTGIEDIDDKECGTIVLAGDFMEKAKHKEDIPDAEKWWDERFIPWCEDHKDQQIVIIGGNCDKWLYYNRDKVEWPKNVHYLDDTETEVNGMKVYGTSWCPHNMNGAWEVDNEKLEEEFSKIPEGLDILITHVPPKGKGMELDKDTSFNDHFGSEALTKAILEKKPKLVLCGHIHTGSHKPIKIGDSVVMNVSRIDKDRYEKAFHGRKIGVERAEGGLGFLVDMEDDGKVSLGKKKDVPKSVIKLRDELRELAKKVNRHVDSPSFSEEPDEESVRKVYKAIKDAEEDLAKFNSPKKKMLEDGIASFKKSVESGFTEKMGRIGKLYDGDRNGVLNPATFSTSHWWDTKWTPFGNGYSGTNNISGYPSYGQHHYGNQYGGSGSQSWPKTTVQPYKGTSKPYVSSWNGGMSVDDILAKYEKKASGGDGESVGSGFPDVKQREQALDVAVEHLMSEGDEVVRNPFSKGWALKEGYGRDGKPIDPKKGAKHEEGKADSGKKKSEKTAKDELYEALVEDEGLPEGQTLQEHDRKHHKGGFNPETDTCKFRDKMSEETETDKGDELDIDNGVGRQEDKTQEKAEAKKPLVTPEEDRAYMEAVKNGDMDTAAEMVREAATRYMQGVSGFVLTNGQPDYFQVSKKPIQPFFIQGAKKEKPIGDRKYFTDAFLNLKNVLDLMDGFPDDKRIGGDNFDEREYGKEMANRFCDLMEKAGYQIDRDSVVDELANGDIESSDPFHRLFSFDRKGKVEALKKLGYDGVVWDFDDNDVYSFDEGSIINAASVLEDDKGRVIPLSQRFCGDTEKHGEAGKEATRETAKVYDGLSNKQVKKYKDQMAKKHPEMDADLVLTELGKIKDRKIQGDAFAWVMRGAVKLPEDLYKVEQARELATKAKKDPLSYNTPQDCINQLMGEGHRVKEKTITVEELKKNPLMSYYRDEGYGVETFQVDDSREGQVLMRMVLDSHWGRDANPWCLLARQGEEGGQLVATEDFIRWKRANPDIAEAPENRNNVGTRYREATGKSPLERVPYALNQAWRLWNHYNSLPKRVAFKDGKLLAFMATDKPQGNEEYEDLIEYWDEKGEWFNITFGTEFDEPPTLEEWAEATGTDIKANEEWWDRKDEPHRGIPIGEVEVPGDSLHRKVSSGELVNGEVQVPSGQEMYVGERGKPGYTVWYGDSDKIKITTDEDGTEVEMSPMGQVRRIRKGDKEAKWEQQVLTGLTDGDATYTFSRYGDGGEITDTIGSAKFDRNGTVTRANPKVTLEEYNKKMKDDGKELAKDENEMNERINEYLQERVDEVDDRRIEAIKWRKEIEGRGEKSAEDELVEALIGEMAS